MVVIINGERYACASCIRGHRVKKCEHTDRPLVAIVKRGRQVSQCNHCRLLRKTNGSHVKCTCAMSGAPNPITGCLCEVINDCSCVASHLRQVKVDDDDNDDSFTLGSSSPYEQQKLFTAPQLTKATGLDIDNQLEAVESSQALTTDGDTKVESSHPQSMLGLHANEPNPISQTAANFQNAFLPNDNAPTTILLGEQDKDLVSFLFSDLDKHLT